MSFKEILFHDLIAWLGAVGIVIFILPVAVKIMFAVKDWLDQRWPY